MSKFTIVRGASGTGKSTRFGIMFEVIAEKYEHETVYHEYTTSAGNTKKGITGEYFPEINTLVMIRKLSNGKYDSLDGLGCDKKKFEHMSDIIRSHNDKNVIAEGNAVCDTFRFDPWFTTFSGFVKSPGGVETEGLGFSEHASIFFLYEDFEEARQRILGRGGKDISDKGLESPVWCHNDKNKTRCDQFDFTKADLFKFKFDEGKRVVSEAILGRIKPEVAPDNKDIMDTEEVLKIVEESLIRMDHERFRRLAMKAKVEREIQVEIDDYAESVLKIDSRFEGEINGVKKIDLILNDTPIELKQYYYCETRSNSKKSAGASLSGLKGDAKKMIKAKGGYAVTVFVGFGDEGTEGRGYDHKVKRFWKKVDSGVDMKARILEDWEELSLEAGVSRPLTRVIKVAEDLEFSVFVNKITIKETNE